MEKSLPFSSNLNYKTTNENKNEDTILLYTIQEQNYTALFYSPRVNIWLLWHKCDSTYGWEENK